MAEVIKRKIKSEILGMDREKYPEVQVAYNTWGHLTVRFFNPENQDEDLLIVFDSHTTRLIAGFLRRVGADP